MPASEELQKVEAGASKAGSAIATGASAIWQWGTVHTVAAAAIVGFAVGFIVKWAWF